MHFQNRFKNKLFQEKTEQLSQPSKKTQKEKEGSQDSDSRKK